VAEIVGGAKDSQLDLPKRWEVVETLLPNGLVNSLTAVKKYHLGLSENRAHRKIDGKITLLSIKVSIWTPHFQVVTGYQTKNILLVIVYVYIYTYIERERKRLLLVISYNISHYINTLSLVSPFSPLNTPRKHVSGL
jgi:hypothetical protein